MGVLNICTFNEEYISLTDIIGTKTCLIAKHGTSFDRNAYSFMKKFS